MTPQKYLSASLHFLHASCSLPLSEDALRGPSRCPSSQWAIQGRLEAVSWVVDVDEKKGKSLFYYVAEVDGHPEKRPLTCWFNGDFREKKTTFKLGESSK
ncbi:hypothetical protein MRB53_021349 [Persea americana]|uniref:Uncharacterized protein n=1 Tax=Persea americana TaxID=3435 RepID=A0ACC2L3V1_PERAE|nr:hypothetical protein MRB53_021349 [Persea americana]